MTAGKGRLVNDGHIKGQLVNDGHSKGQLVNDGHSKGQLVNDGHKFDSFWGHSPTFTALYSSPLWRWRSRDCATLGSDSATEEGNMALIPTVF